MSPLAQGTIPAAPLPTPPAIPQVPGVAVPTVSLEQLLAQEIALSQQVVLLGGQRRELARQIRGMPAGEARVTAQGQLAALDGQLASARGALGSVRAQISARMSARPGMAGVPDTPPSRSNGLNGDQVAAIFITFTLAVLMPLSLGITRRLWRRRTAATPAEDTITPRLDRLEHAVDAIAIEIERISEGQRFVTKVMTERPTARVVPSAEQADPAGLGEGKPFLALGAGPIEPIPVAQRQAVRQSITPH